MRCKACNKIMDTPANWLNPDKKEDDMCASCVKSGETDWDVREYCFGDYPVSGLTPSATDYDDSGSRKLLKHGLFEESP